MMKKFGLILIFMWVAHFSIAQELTKIDTLHEEIEGLRKFYGYAAGITPDHLLIIGGAVQSEEEELLNGESNDRLLLRDWNSDTTITASLSVYPKTIREALNTVKLQYYQEDNLLYIIGGYGYWTDCNCQTTIPSLIVMEVSKTINAIKNAQNPSPYVRQIIDDRMSVMDGFLEKSGDTFFLLEGRKAYKLEAKEDDAFYFVSEYDNQVRSFKVVDDGKELRVAAFNTWTDLEAFFDAFADQLAGTFLGSGEYKFKMEKFY